MSAARAFVLLQWLYTERLWRVRLHQLRKRYIGPDGTAVPVVDVEDLSLAAGEQVALMGTSGSGKTTLLHLIAGILTPDSGEILFRFEDDRPIEVRGGSHDGTGRQAARGTDGVVDITRLTEAQRDAFRGRYMGYIFQTHHLLPGFTALENVLLGMSFTGRPHDREWAKHLLREVGLADRLDYRPQKLSVGQQQRVAVARALANRPKLVLADEPTGALDSNNAQQVLELIRRLCADVQAMLLLVSHDLNIARQLPRVVSLRN